MRQPLRKEKIYQILSTETSHFNPKNPESNTEALQIGYISEKTGISPNNISMELGRLFAEGLVMRVRGRPVTYLSIPVLEKVLGTPLLSHEFPSMGEFYNYLNPPVYTTLPSDFCTELNAAAMSEFDSLIGCEESLKAHIEQAKAAILYPPHGLDTLLTGPTGVGKSHFAHSMFDFAKKRKDCPGGRSRNL